MAAPEAEVEAGECEVEPVEIVARMGPGPEPEAHGIEAFEQMLASFAYKNPLLSSPAALDIQGPETLPPPHPSPPPPPRRNIEEKNTKKNKKKKKKKKKKKEKHLPACTSSYIRATVDGKAVVLSRFFPLPPNASSVEPITKGEVHRPKMPRSRRTKAIDPLSAAAESDSGSTKWNWKSKSEAEQDYGDVSAEKQQRKGKKRTSPLLSAAQKRSEAYRRVPQGNIMWVPPPSPFNLLQERHYFDPWRVLIICMLLNVTTGAQVKKVLGKLFCICPDAETMAKVVPVEEIEEVIAPLGLQKKRAELMKRFSKQYLEPEWTHVTQLHGVGKYAADAYAIFCVGKPKEVTPHDHKLVHYWEFVCNMQCEGEEKPYVSRN